MNEILVTIYVLGLDEEYDMFLPIGLGMKDCLNLIQSTIKELSDEKEINALVEQKVKNLERKLEEYNINE